jgi:hypothetical protein
MSAKGMGCPALSRTSRIDSAFERAELTSETARRFSTIGPYDDQSRRSI